MNKITITMKNQTTTWISLKNQTKSGRERLIAVYQQLFLEGKILGYEVS